MQTEELIHVFSELKDYIDNNLVKEGELKEAILKAFYHNPWFTEENVQYALKAIATDFLDPEKIQNWLNSYEIKNHPSKSIGIIMAGNIPLAGFHDLLCVLLSGNITLVKLSSKDNILLPFLVKKMIKIDERIKHKIVFTENLKGMHALIATGSNNTFRYFDYYFGKYPHIFRKNRNSVAILDGTESNQELKNLGEDIFRYFGLGCRNVSKLYVPKGYDFKNFFEAIETYGYVMEHNKYKNNYDYNRTLFLLNNITHFSNDFLMLKESESLASPLATLHYQYYEDVSLLDKMIENDRAFIQCIVGKNFLPFGKSQSPDINEYADNVDTMEFLKSF